MKNKFIAFLLAVTATLSISTAAFAQGHGYRGGNNGFHGGQVYHGGPVYHDNRGWDRGYNHGNRGWDRGYDHGNRGWDRGWDRGRGNWGRDFGLGFGLGYLFAPRYYGPSYYGPSYDYAPRYYSAPPVIVAPAPQLYVDQYGREYYLDIDGYAVFTGRRY